MVSITEYLLASPCIHHSNQCECVWIQLLYMRHHSNHIDNVVGKLHNPSSRSHFYWCTPKDVWWKYWRKKIPHKDDTFRLGSLSSGHSEIQTHEALVASALQTRPAPQWILIHGSTNRGIVRLNEFRSNYIIFYVTCDQASFHLFCIKIGYSLHSVFIFMSQIVVL